MTLKDKIIFTLLTIFTLGIYLLVIKSKKTEVKTELPSDEKLKINSEAVIKGLGGKSNIASAEYTYSKVKVFIYKKEIVDLELLKDIKGISGIAGNSSNVTLIVGKQSKPLAAELIK